MAGISYLSPEERLRRKRLRDNAKSKCSMCGGEKANNRKTATDICRKCLKIKCVLCGQDFDKRSTQYEFHAQCKIRQIGEKAYYENYNHRSAPRKDIRPFKRPSLYSKMGS